MNKRFFYQITITLTVKLFFLILATKPYNCLAGQIEKEKMSLFHRPLMGEIFRAMGGRAQKVLDRPTSSVLEQVTSK